MPSPSKSQATLAGMTKIRFLPLLGLRQGEISSGRQNRRDHFFPGLYGADSRTDIHIIRYLRTTVRSFLLRTPDLMLSAILNVGPRDVSGKTTSNSSPP